MAIERINGVEDLSILRGRRTSAEQLFEHVETKSDVSIFLTKVAAKGSENDKQWFKSDDAPHQKTY